MEKNGDEAIGEVADSSLNSLVNVQLTAVVFLMDYIQLQFSNLVITAYTHPQVLMPEQDISWGQAGYRDALCASIGHSVTSADIRMSDAVAITFDNCIAILISLRDSDYIGPEAVMFQNLTGTQIYDWWVI